MVNLKIPRLRERPLTSWKLADYFVRKYSEANGLPVRPMSTEARRALGAQSLAGQCARTRKHAASRGAAQSWADIGVDGITPDGARLDQSRGPRAVAHAAIAAEQVTRKLVGRTVAEVERDLILETLKHCLGNRTHAANILGISIRTLRNKLNEYTSDGVPVPPPNGGEQWEGRGVDRPRRPCLNTKPGAKGRAFSFSDTIDSAPGVSRSSGRHHRTAFLPSCRARYQARPLFAMRSSLHGFQALSVKFAPDPRQAIAPVGGFDQVFLEIRHDISIGAAGHIGYRQNN